MCRPVLRSKRDKYEGRGAGAVQSSDVGVGRSALRAAHDAGDGDGGGAGSAHSSVEDVEGRGSGVGVGGTCVCL